MASDGLWDYLPDPEIVSTAVDVFEREGPQAAAEALVSQVWGEYGLVCVVVGAVIGH